jgi:hypothetical protein
MLPFLVVLDHCKVELSEQETTFKPQQITLEMLQ